MYLHTFAFTVLDITNLYFLWTYPGQHCALIIESNFLVLDIQRWIRLGSVPWITASVAKPGPN